MHETRMVADLMAQASRLALEHGPLQTVRISISRRSHVTPGTLRDLWEVFAEHTELASVTLEIVQRDPDEGNGEDVILESVTTT